MAKGEIIHDEQFILLAQFNSIQYMLLHKTTNNMYLAIKEIIKSTNGKMDFSEEFAII